MSFEAYHLLSTVEILSRVSNMKFLCFLFFTCAIQSAFSQLGNTQNGLPQFSVGVGSVIDLYSNIPRCSGTFVSADSLLTSASCLFCDQDCDMRVEILDTYTDALLYYDVKQIMIHDDYEVDPSRNDIGLVKIKGEVPPHLVLNYADLPPSQHDIAAYYFTVKFYNGVTLIEMNSTTLISNAKCSMALHNYMPSDVICSYSPKGFHFQEHDQGSPLLYDHHGQLALTAIYVPEKHFTAPGSKIAAYEKIGPHIPWINKNAKNMSETACLTKIPVIYSPKGSPVPNGSIGIQTPAPQQAPSQRLPPPQRNVNVPPQRNVNVPPQGNGLPPQQAPVQQAPLQQAPLQQSSPSLNNF